MKRFTMFNMIALIAVVAIMFMSTSCLESDRSADSLQTKQSETSFKEAQRELGLPNIVNWMQKKTLKEIYELCDQEDLLCYVYLWSPYLGKMFYLGRGIGYGIPFSAQFTNPEKIVEGDKELGKDWSGRFIMKKPQADPNGLFMPTSSSATWVIMIDKEAEPRPVYMEPNLIVSPFQMPDWLVIKGPEGYK